MIKLFIYIKQRAEEEKETDLEITGIWLPLVFFYPLNRCHADKFLEIAIRGLLAGKACFLGRNLRNNRNVVQRTFRAVLAAKT